MTLKLPAIRQWRLEDLSCSQHRRCLMWNNFTVSSWETLLEHGPALRWAESLQTRTYEFGQFDRQRCLPMNLITSSCPKSMCRRWPASRAFDNCAPVADHAASSGAPPRERGENREGGATPPRAQRCEEDVVDISHW